MSYADFFKRAMRTEEQPHGLTPFPYQFRLEESPKPELLNFLIHATPAVPTATPS